MIVNYKTSYDSCHIPVRNITGYHPNRFKHMILTLFDLEVLIATLLLLYPVYWLSNKLKIEVITFTPQIKWICSAKS